MSVDLLLPAESIYMQALTYFPPPALLTWAVHTVYFKGRVTLFFANNYLPEHRITMEF